MMKYSMITLLFIALTFNSFSTELWEKISINNTNNKEKVYRNNIPQEAYYYSLDLQKLKELLTNAPEKGDVTEDLILKFPMANGNLENFKILHSSIMHPELSAKFPMIKTYVAQGIDDPTAYMRFSVTQFGLHTMCLSGNRSANFIDPYTKDQNYYIVYNKTSLGNNTQQFECLMDEEFDYQSKTVNNTTAAPAIDDQKIRKYRLALSCTAEYGNIFGTSSGTELADIQAQMTISINRVNLVFEIDLGITLEFIANNYDIIFFGSTSSDPWTGASNTVTAQTIDNLIGVANYDIGHNFNTDGGGNAGCLACVCIDTDQSFFHKGRGYTGRTDPTGDPFDIDYVAHEMGHQFGGYHTMNTCSRSGNGQTEVEPASGSSIMGYAGICGTNVQSHSDDHFNYVNVRDISANIKPGGNSNCAEEISTTNSPPIANAGQNYTIPKSTAFVLEGSATDPDGLASLTYNWSQNDPAEAPNSGSPSPTWVVGPLYRSISPTTSPNRYLPKLSDVIAGNLTPTWEVTPSVGRTMNFSFIVRDNDILGAQTADDLMEVTVADDAGPFVVTSQNSTENWETGNSQLVTWDVAGTNSGSVNTSNVDIFLSLDGGYTYPITLASNVINDGSETVNVPSGSVTTNGKIMVRGAGNIFYALNNGSISIQEGDMSVSLSNNSSISCSFIDVVYDFTYTPLNGFNENVVFSITDLPSGIIATFSPTNTTNATSVQLILSNITASNIGVHTMILNTVASSVNVTNTLTLDVATTPSAPSLISPLDGSNVLFGDVFEWSATAGIGVTYEIEISTTSDFLNIIETASLTSNTYSPSQILNDLEYYWRIRTINDCGTSSYSSEYMFLTNSCAIISATDLPVSIYDNSAVSSFINFSSTENVTDINILNLGGMHSFLGDLVVTLTSPSNTVATLWSFECGSNADFLINFDDDASSSTFPCPATDNGTYLANDLLSIFIGEPANGDWVLTITDGADGDVGVLNSWSIEICTGEIVCENMPDAPVISASTNNICAGDMVTLSVNSGDLNDATNWVWYENSCGGTNLGTGNLYNTFPNQTISYFVRGEGGCTSDSAICSSVTVNVEIDVVVNDTVSGIDSAQVNNQWYYSSQMVTNTYTSFLGCDSTVETSIEITTKPNSIYNLQTKDVFKVFPNPSEGVFIINLNSSVLMKLKNEIVIYNTLGQEVFKKETIDSEQITVDLSKYSKGVYHIFLSNEKYMWSEDIVLY